MHFCTGFQPNWTDCSQQTQPLFQAVLCTAGTVNWGTVSADVCLGKLSVLDCIQLQYSDKRSYSSLAIVQLLILLQNGSCFNCLVDLNVVFLITVIILILNCSFRWSVFFHVSRISWSWKYTLEKVSIFSIFFLKHLFCVKLWWFEMHNTCFRPKLNLFWHVCFTWKNKTFGCCWLFLRPASEPKDDFYCCCYVQYMLWICLWVCPGNLPPLVPGGSLGGIITHLVSKEELLCSLIPSPPHKCYFLSYLAPTARVSEGILHLEGFFFFSSQLICK